MALAELRVRVAQDGQIIGESSRKDRVCRARDNRDRGVECESRFDHPGAERTASVFSWVKHATHYEGRESGAWGFALLRLYQRLGDHVGFFGVSGR